MSKLLMARQRTRLLEHIVDARQVYSQQDCVRISDCFFRGTGSGTAAGLLGQAIKLTLRMGIAECDLMTGSGKQCSQFAADEAGAEPIRIALSFRKCAAGVRGAAGSALA